jgi:hypothetical protein
MFMTAIIATWVSHAARLAMRDGREDRRARVHSRHEIGDGDTGLLRSASGQVVPLAGHAHESAHALDDEIVAGAFGVGSALAEAGDRAVDQSWVHRGEARVVEPVFRKPADLEVLDDDVSGARQIAHDGLTFALREIDGDGLLAAVAREVIRRLTGIVARLVLEKRRSPAARIVARDRLLDLDDRST